VARGAPAAGRRGGRVQRLLTDHRIAWLVAACISPGRCWRSARCWWH